METCFIREDADDLVPDISDDPGADAPEVEPRTSADREVMPADEPPPEGNYPRDPEMERRRERGKAALKAKAKISFFHYAKNDVGYFQTSKNKKK